MVAKLKLCRDVRCILSVQPKAEHKRTQNLPGEAGMLFSNEKLSQNFLVTRQVTGVEWCKTVNFKIRDGDRKTQDF